MEVVHVLHCDGVDEVLVPLEQFEHPFFLSKGLNCSMATCLSCLMNLITSSSWYWPALLV